MRSFSRYIGIDYSGAETPTASLKGLRAYVAIGSEAPVKVPPPTSPRRYWTRRGLAEWLATTFRAEPPTVVGIDHAFSFPRAYFQKHGLADGWQGSPRWRRLTEQRSGSAKSVFHFGVPGSVA